MPVGHHGAHVAEHLLEVAAQRLEQRGVGLAVDFEVQVRLVPDDRVQEEMDVAPGTDRGC